MAEILEKIMKIHRVKKNTFFFFCMYKMVEISADTFAKSSIHTIEQLRKGKKLALWIRIKDIGRELDVENIYDLIDKEIKGKFKTNNFTDEQNEKYKRHGSELIESEQFMYAHECIIIPIIMHCRVSTPKSIEFKSKLGFNQFDITLTKEQSILKSVMDTFERENMQTQYSVLGYRIDIYFHDYRLAIEVDEKGHKDRNTNDEIQGQKALEKELGCKFIRINSDEEIFNIFKTINETNRHIKESTKKITKNSAINDVKELLKAASKLRNNDIISTFTRNFVKHFLPTI